MTNFARVINNIAVDVSTKPELAFHPALAAEFVKVPDKVQVQWRLVGGTWSAPTDDVAMPVVAIITQVSRTVFMRLFTGPERVAIKNTRATDDLVEDFFSFVEDPDSGGVDLTLQSTLDALLHLQSLEIITDERRLQILAGVAQ